MPLRPLDFKLIRNQWEHVLYENIIRSKGKLGSEGTAAPLTLRPKIAYVIKTSLHLKRPFSGITVVQTGYTAIKIVAVYTERKVKPLILIVKNPISKIELIHNNFSFNIALVCKQTF